jgi:hypothetical protein
MPNAHVAQPCVGGAVKIIGCLGDSALLPEPDRSHTGDVGSYCLGNLHREGAGKGSVRQL